MVLLCSTPFIIFEVLKMFTMLQAKANIIKIARMRKSMKFKYINIRSNKI